MEKAQSSIEFVVLIIFVLFFFSVLFIEINENMADKLNEKQNFIIKDIALNVQSEIDLAFNSDEGYIRRFNVPEKAGSKDYNINIIEDMVYVKTNDNKYAVAFPIQHVTGNVMKGLNEIKKENGIVKINE